VSSRAVVSKPNLSFVDRLRPVIPPFGFESEPDIPGPLLILTPRERDVLRGIMAGRTNKEMARSLGLKEQGIKNVLSIVFQKCQVRSRLELALFALRHDLADSPPA